MQGGSVGRVIAVVVCLLAVTGVASAQTPGTSTSGPFSITAEALLWWFKGNATPPLVTDGVLGEPGTHVLLGGKDLDTNPNPGVRLRWEYASNDVWGLESSAFYVPTRTASRSVSSSGLPGSRDIFVPVIDATTGEESTQAISFAGVFSGHAREELSNNLIGADLNATVRLVSGGGWRLDALIGGRYLRLYEKLEFTTASPFIPPFPSDVYQTTDRFEATNNFFGGQLGVRVRFDQGPFFANAVAKVGLGVMRQTLGIEGTLLTNDFNNFGTPLAYPGGGYFATPTNIGERSRHVFAVVPEGNLNVGFRLTSWMAVVVGYTFLYATDVIRAPQQIVRTVNYSSSSAPPGVPTGPQQPEFKFKSTDFWAHGLNAGLNFRF
jgi:hypothetical protein